MPPPRRACLWLALCFVVSFLSAGATEEDKSNGFNSNIDWHSLEDMDGFDYSKNRKPIMYVFNRPWCGACKRLKSEFVGKEGMKIAELAKQFVMVNIAHDVPEKKWTPDGIYIPRILFAQPNGELRTEIKNKMGNPKYGYFYSSAWEVEKGMQNALARITDHHAEL